MLSLNVRIRKRLRWIYVLTDLVTTNVAMVLFNVFRVVLQDSDVTLSVFYTYPRVLWGQLLFPLLMMGFFWLSGYYNRVESRSRAQEVMSTFYSSLLGALSIFFLATVNDVGWRRRLAFEYLFAATGILFVCVYAGRYVITSLVVRRSMRQDIPDEAVMFGTDGDAVKLAGRINDTSEGDGFIVRTLVRLHPADEPSAGCSGFNVIERSALRRYCQSHSVSSMVLTQSALGNGEELSELMRIAAEMNGALYVSPDVNSVALASRRSFNVVGEPLVCISSPNIPDSTANVKRAVDIAGSTLALVLLSPLMLALAIGVKRDSRGPVLFAQERLGYGGKPFKIYKFRSMKVDAESDGCPRVTVDDDPRITRFGHFMRKYRLDELPQFWNVLRGEMSLVGPRPERQWFAAQIAERVPLYPLVYQVRPGITSWGMVRFGYASNVDQMVERLRYDLIYLENISILTDIKILLHTVRTVLSGRGK